METLLSPSQPTARSLLMSLARCSLFVLLVAVSGCDTAETFEVGGTYVSESGPDVLGQSIFASLTLPTTASGDRFAFSYVFEVSTPEADDRNEGTGTGRYDHPTLTLALDGSTTTGTVSPDGNRIVLDEQTTPPFVVYVRQGR